MRKRSSVVMAVVAFVLSLIPALGLVTGATAAPDVKTAVQAKKSTISCDGQTFSHGGISFNFGGGRFAYTFGFRDGKPRMAKVYTNDGSYANFALGSISWSGAVVESSGSGRSYCITFPGSSKGIVATGKKGGNTWRDTFYFQNAKIAAKKSSTISCNGSTFDYNGVLTLFGNGQFGYEFGTKYGKIRMARVITYSPYGSNANLSLGSISSSGAVVESGIWGSSYCIMFPATTQGVIVKARRDGNTYKRNVYF